MKTFTIYAALIAMFAVTGCVSHEKETIVEKQPADRTVVVVPPQQ